MHFAGIAGVAMMLLVPRFAAGTDWTRFRGPNGRGVADAANPPTDLDPSNRPSLGRFFLLPPSDPAS